jgi:hypothetical protein
LRGHLKLNYKIFNVLAFLSTLASLDSLRFTKIIISRSPFPVNRAPSKKTRFPSNRVH